MKPLHMRKWDYRVWDKTWTGWRTRAVQGVCLCLCVWCVCNIQNIQYENAEIVAMLNRNQNCKLNCVVTASKILSGICLSSLWINWMRMRFITVFLALLKISLICKRFFSYCAICTAQTIKCSIYSNQTIECHSVEFQYLFYNCTSFEIGSTEEWNIEEMDREKNDFFFFVLKWIDTIESSE